MARNERGFTSVWVLLLSLFIVVMGIAAFDVWHVFTEQRTIAARADAAAAAGAQALDVARFNDSNGSTLALDVDDAESLAAQRLAADLGVTEVPSCAGSDPESGTCWDIKVANPPGAAPSVTVTVRRRVGFSLLPGSQVVVATSTASPQVA